MTLQEVYNLPVDEKGIVVLIVENRQRRFVKEKLIAHLEKIQDSGDYKIPKARKLKPQKEKRPVGRPRVRFPKQKKPLGSHRRRPVIAILPDGTEQHFISCKQASDILKIGHTNISKAIDGKTYRHVEGIRFKSIQILTA